MIKSVTECLLGGRKSPPNTWKKMPQTFKNNYFLFISLTMKKSFSHHNKRVFPVISHPNLMMLGVYDMF